MRHWTGNSQETNNMHMNEAYDRLETGLIFNSHSYISKLEKYGQPFHYCMLVALNLYNLSSGKST